MKSLGYFISIVSVLLLGLVSWQATVTNPALRLPLLLGMATSVVGMVLRWAAYRREVRQKA